MHERDLNNTVTPNPKLAIDYCGIKMKNPIIAASGTFGNGPEYAGYLDLSNEIGAISVKGLTPKGRHGNPGTRTALALKILELNILLEKFYQSLRNMMYHC